MEGFGSKYLLIYSTTKSILLRPFEFGNGIGDTIAETKQAATYLGEGFLFFYSILKFLDSGGDVRMPFAGLPFGDELLALSIVAMTILTGLVVHPFARLFSGSKTAFHGTLASFLYWSGFCLFIIPPVFVALILGLQAMASHLDLSEGLHMLAFMALAVPFMFVYYMASICTWLAKVHNTEPIIAGLAILAAYAVSSGFGLITALGLKTLMDAA